MKTWSISFRFSLAVALCVFVSALLIGISTYNQAMTHAIEEAEAKADLILKRNLATHTYFSHQLKPTLFAYVDPILTDDDFDPVWMSSTYAVREIDKYFKELTDTDYYYKECAIHARSPQNEADDYEKRFIEALNTDPTLQREARIRTIDGKTYLNVLHRGETMERSCLRCHSVADAAPGRMIEIYGAENSFHRSENEVVSAISIRIPISETREITLSIYYSLIAFSLVVLLMLVLIVVWLNRYLVIHPLTRITSEANKIATDLSYLGETIPLVFGKEFNALAASFNSMSEALLRNRETLEIQVESRTRELQKALLALEKDIQKRKAVEGQLRKSRDLLEISQNVAHLGSYEADLVNDKIYWSDELFRIYGRNPEDYPEPFVREQSNQWAHPDDVDMINETVASVALKTESDFSLDFRIIHANGEVLFVHSMHRIMYNEEKAPIALHGTLQDITELKRSEEARGSSEKKYRDLFEHAPIGIFQYRAEGGHLQVNPTFARMAGFKSPEEVYKHVEHPGDLFMDPKHKESMDRMLSEVGEIVQLESRLYRREASPLWISIFASRRLDPVEKRPCIYGFATDVTMRKKAENALRESERQLQRAMRMAKMGNWKLDLNTDLMHTSHQASEIYGIRSQSLPFDAVKKVPLPEYRELLDTAMGDLIEENRPYDVEFKIRRPSDGKVVDIHSMAEYDSVQNMVVGTIQDVTAQKEEERKRKKLEEQLKQSQKLESIGLLAGGIAHDFNNLLTGISGNISLVQMDTDPDDPMHEVFTELLEATDRSTELVRQLLAFSRKQIIVPILLDVNDVIQALEKLLSKLIGEDIQFDAVYGKNLPQIKADRNQLEHLLVNLAVNARDAMPEGGTLSIETAVTDLDEVYCQAQIDLHPGRYLQISVSDTGTGIEKKYLEKIFDPFFTTKPLGEGTGLGLSSVIGTVKQHHGHIQVYSELGQGTTFKVFFPVYEMDIPAGQQEDVSTLNMVGNETILLVEDDKNVRKMTQKALESKGYQVLSAASGEEALEILTVSNAPIHMLLTDVVMPGMNGRLLAQSVLQRVPGVSILFMSGYTENVITRHGILEEGVHFISKPFSPDSLAVKVREILDASSV